VNVILTKDVQHLGKTGQTVLVKDGYARNFLIPKGLAFPATVGHAAQVKSTQAARARHAEALKQKAQDLAKRLSEISCTVPVAVGAQGKLHGAVTAADVAEALQAQGILLDKHQISLEGPVTQLGVHQIPVKLHPEVTATLRVSVVQK